MVLVEVLVMLGLPPLGPAGWPGVGTIAAAAFFGAWGFAGGAAVTAIYVMANLAHAERFAQYFAGPGPSTAWAIGLAVLGSLVLALRERLVQAYIATLLGPVLRESEARFRHLTELSSDWYWEQDREFRFTSVSGRGGIEGPELRGQTRWDIPAPNLSDEDWQRHREVLERHAPFRDFVIQRRGIDGAARWASINGDPMFDERQGFTGYRGIGRDVTEQKQAEEALRRAREQLEQALEGSSAALWDTDLRSGRVFLSQVWADIVGAPRSARVATVEELLALVHPDDIAAVKRASLEAMKGSVAAYAVEHRVRSRNGEWRWIISRGRVTERDPATGRAVRMIGINIPR